MKKIIVISLLTALIIFLTVVYKNSQEQPTSAGIANPASTNCINKGGQLRIQTSPDGSQYGMCFFGDDMACEEWALLRGKCPVGGVIN